MEEALQMMKKTTVLQLCLALVLVALVCAPAANATAALKICDGLGNCLTADDTTLGGTATATGAASGIFAASTGSVTIIGKVGVFNVNVDTGLSKPIIGSTMDPNMDLSLQTVSTAAGQLTVQWSDAAPPGFLLVPGTAVAHAGGTNGGTTTAAGNTIAYTTSFNSTTPGTLFVAGTTLTSQTFGPFGAGTTSFSGDAAGGLITTAPYELMQQLVFTAVGATQASGDFHLSIVPEPASIILLGGVLLVTARTLRRRAKNA
jgi:hypothetical protein